MVDGARSFGETIVAETEHLLELEAAFLVSLAENNCPTDIAEFLTRGDAMRGVPPRLIQKAIKAIILLGRRHEWRAVYNVTHPKVWGLETTDPAALDHGEETIVAPCMPEHAARAIVEAYNSRGLALGVVGGSRK